MYSNVCTEQKQNKRRTNKEKAKRKIGIVASGWATYVQLFMFSHCKSVVCLSVSMPELADDFFKYIYASEFAYYFHRLYVL